MTSLLTGNATPGTPAPAGVGALVDGPFAWAHDATYVTLPVVRDRRSPAFEVLLRRSLDIVARVGIDLELVRDLRQELRDGTDTVNGELVIVPRPGDDVSARDVHPGTIALEQLREWLAWPLDDIVELVGLSPSVRQFWRNNPSAAVRPAKAGRLLRFRTAVGLLVGSVGAEQARQLLHSEEWLTGPLDDRRLVALEARGRDQLAPGPLQAPPALEGLTREQLLEAVADRAGEEAQRRLESSRDTGHVARAQEDAAR